MNSNGSLRGLAEGDYNVLNLTKDENHTDFKTIELKVQTNCSYKQKLPAHIQTFEMFLVCNLLRSKLNITYTINIE